MLWDLPYFTLTGNGAHALLIDYKWETKQIRHREMPGFDIFCTVFQCLPSFPEGVFILETTTENHRPQKSKERTWI